MFEEQIENAIKQLSESGKADLCEKLIRIHGVKSPAIAQAAFESGVYRPAILYQDAPPELRDKLIDLLEHGKTDQLKLHESSSRHLSGESLSQRKADNCLTALAMIGDDTVAEYFQKWEKFPKAWHGLVYASPLAYAYEGGWCIEDGRRKPLYFEECYALEQSEEPSPADNVCGRTASEKCPYCGSSYMNILILDGRDERLSFLGIDGKISIKYCESCLPWTESVFCRYTEDGESTVFRHEGGKDCFFADEELNDRAPFVLSKKMVPKNYSDDSGCAVGGKPEFVDAPDYIACPECGKRMMHLAQLGMDFTYCGTHYIQICRDCKIVTATYQQT